MPASYSSGFSPSETARYTQEMVESLSRIANQQGQSLLAHLLDLASVEARIQAGQGGQDTPPPG